MTITGIQVIPATVLEATKKAAADAAVEKLLCALATPTNSASADAAAMKLRSVEKAAVASAAAVKLEATAAVKLAEAPADAVKLTAAPPENVAGGGGAATKFLSGLKPLRGAGPQAAGGEGK